MRAVGVCSNPTPPKSLLGGAGSGQQGLRLAMARAGNQYRHKIKRNGNIQITHLKADPQLILVASMACHIGCSGREWQAEEFARWWASR